MTIDHANLGRLDLNLLVALDALLTECSVTRAASRVGLGQSAMSYNLARLRQLFGDEILTRGPDGMRPTPRALALKEPVRGVLVQVQALILPEKPFDPSVPLPLVIKRGALPAGTFRESEIHITIDRDESDPRLISQLTEMGLYSGFLPKSYGVAQVMTVQGSRRDIATVKPAVLQYLHDAGGARRGSIKEERIVDWWVSAPGLALPPVIQAIEWR